MQTAVGFAFATADVLIEISETLQITFAAGACNALIGLRDTALIDRKLGELIVRADRSLLTGLVHSIQPGGRFQNRAISVQRPDGATLPVSVSGFRPHHRPQHLCLALSMAKPSEVAPPPGARDEGTGLLTADAFGQQLEALDRTKGDIDRELTLLEVPGLGEWRKRVGERKAGELLESIGGLLRVHAEGDLAGYLDDGRFGIVHGGELTADALKNQIQAMPAAAGAGLELRSVSIDPNDTTLSEQDVSRVLRFVVQRFTEGNPDVFKWNTPAALVDAMVSATVTEMGEMRGMLRDGTVSILYQPIVSLHSEEVHHYEALSRFANKNTGDAIKFAEDTGIIYDLDFFVCEQVLQELDSREAAARVPIALNMSAHSLVSDVFVETFRRLMASRPTLIRQILIELTETVEIADFERAANALRQLRADGHKVCIDDFGVGSTSFHYVRAFDVDFLKIDGMYIEEVGRHPKTDSIVKALIDVGHRSNIGVIAERVETRQQAGTLLGLGCEFAQGYLFAKPGPGMDYRPPPRPVAAGKRRGAREQWG